MLRNKYNIYTSPKNGIKHGGLTIGVTNSIHSEAGPAVDVSICQRLLLVSITTPTAQGSNNMDKTMIAGIYAPQAPKAEECKEFWSKAGEEMAKHERWIAMGDFNIILNHHEALPWHHLQDNVNTKANHYRTEFLDKTAGTDLWTFQNDVDAHEDYTCFHDPSGSTENASQEDSRESSEGAAQENASQEDTHGSPEGETQQTAQSSSTVSKKGSKSIIDRVAVSGNIPAGTIETIKQRMHKTDHRPVLARLAIPVLKADAWTNHHPPARLRRPKSKKDACYSSLRDTLDRHLVEHPDLLHDINSPEQFDVIYSQISRVFIQVCDSCFERPSPPKPPQKHAPNREEKHLMHAIKICKSARVSLLHGDWGDHCKTLNHIDHKILGCSRADTQEQAMAKLNRVREDAVKRLKKIEHDRITEAGNRAYNEKVQYAIMSGSTKHMLPNTSLKIPPIVRHPNKPNEYIHEPAKHIKAWREHTKRLLNRTAPPDTEKPWLDTPAREGFRTKLAARQFVWPVMLTTADLIQQLKRGNPTPAPGPDDWEKWALTSCSERFLQVVVNLANYIITTNYFSKQIKQNYLIPIYKKGDSTEPTNYRGIVLANQLQIIVASWFTYNLSLYVWDMGLIPDTQIASQMGTRVGDMTHLLNALDGHAAFTRQTIYALKRDQKKGFDYVHESAFADAVSFFNLPASVLDFDTARTANVGISVKVRGQTARPIYTNGQIKQGDPFSPLKYVLITAMAVWWIKDCYSDAGFKLSTPDRPHATYRHTAAETKSLTLQCPSAMDDTILLASSPADLEALAYCMEFFQAAYNMETEWDKPDKTIVFTLGEQDEKKHKLIAPVSITLPDDSTKTLPVTRIRNFLKTPINSTLLQGRELLNIVNNFSIPRPGRELPITALRRIAHITLAGKVLARLQLHPVTETTALDLNKALNGKIAQYYKQPFRASPFILTAPTEKGGMDFPDFRKLNFVWSVTALHRSLNSNNPTIKTAFEIIHATWQCDTKRGGSCYIPFGPKLTAARGGAVVKQHKAWGVPKKYIERFELKLIPSAEVNNSTWAPHQKKADHASELNLKSHALSWVNKVLDIPTQSAPAGKELLWATDGSTDQTPMLKPSRTAIAAVGPLKYSAKLADNFATSQDAEIMAVAATITMDLGYRKLHKIPDTSNTVIISDFLNVVRRVNERHRTATAVAPSQASRHALRWLYAVARSHPNLTMIHQKAHAEDTAKEAKLNAKADELAKKARGERTEIRIPTEFQDAYSLWTKQTGITHNEVTKTLEAIWDDMQDDEAAMHRTGNVIDYQPHRLLKNTPRAFSAQVQLWARSNQLPTQDIKRKRYLYTASDTCLLCAHPVLQTNPNHVFVHCDGMRAPRQAAKEAARKLTDKFLNAKDIRDQSIVDAHRDLANKLFEDGDMWAQGASTYYRGELPINFTYHKRLSELYTELCAEAFKLTAHIWGKNNAAAAKAKNDRLPNLTPARPATRAERLLALQQAEQDSTLTDAEVCEVRREIASLSRNTAPTQ